MILENGYLVVNKDTGEKDKLGNAIYSTDKIEILFRISGWSNEEKSILGRELTENTTKVHIKNNELDYSNAKGIEIKDKVYPITNMLSNHRWDILYIRGYRNEY